MLELWIYKHYFEHNRIINKEIIIDKNCIGMFTMKRFLLWKLLAGVMILSAVVNRFRLYKLTKVDKFVMSYGGLRGAVAFALVLLINPHHVKLRPMLVTTTIAVVYFTVFFQVLYHVVWSKLELEKIIGTVRYIVLFGGWGFVWVSSTENIFVSSSLTLTWFCSGN